jgi:hypothetical protein
VIFAYLIASRSDWFTEAAKSPVWRNPLFSDTADLRDLNTITWKVPKGSWLYQNGKALLSLVLNLHLRREIPRDRSQVQLRAKVSAVGLRPNGEHIDRLIRDSNFNTDEPFSKAGEGFWESYGLGKLEYGLGEVEIRPDEDLMVSRHGRGDSFATPLFPGEQIRTDTLFETQSKRWLDGKDDDEAPEPIPDWIVPPEMKVGLEYFFHLGHPERRWEFWDNKARSVLAFGSAAEASARLDYFLTEASCWEALPRPKIAQLASAVQQTEAGRFQLTRRGRLVYLDVAVDGRRHQAILTRWADRKAWDWGEENV